MMTAVGVDTPRLESPAPPYKSWTRKNTEGFRCIEFARDFLGIEFMPWQRHAVLAMLALDGSGNFLYRTVLVLVGRQSGKSTLLKVVTLFLMFIGTKKHGPVREVLGAAQSRNMARELWRSAIAMAEEDDELNSEIEKIAEGSGAQELKLENGSRYRITASTRGAGRGLSIDLLLFDELREQRDWSAWDALSSTTIARPNSLILGASNAGDDESIVLNQLRESALAGTDPSTLILEWSAPDGADIDDEANWAMGCPGLGHTVDIRALRGMRATMAPNGFRTEIMCQRVDVLDSLVPMDGWLATTDSTMSFEGTRGKQMFCIDVSPDLEHVTLCAAVRSDDDRVRVGVVDSWSSTEAARKALPGILADAKPHTIAWFPGGPAAALGADLGKIKGTKVVEIKGADVPAACQGLVETVTSRRLTHPGDPLLTAHVTGASRLITGDGYRFTRKGGRCDAAYAAAGAVHLARTQRLVGRPRVVTGAA